MEPLNLLEFLDIDDEHELLFLKKILY